MANELVSNFTAMLESMSAHDMDYNRPVDDGGGFWVGDTYCLMPSVKPLRPTGCDELLSMLRNPPPVQFELPVKKNTDDNFELNDCDENGDPQVYKVFRESNGRRDEWRHLVLSGPRKDKSMPYDATHRAYFAMTCIKAAAMIKAHFETCE